MTRPARPFLTAFVAAGFAATLLFDAPGVLAQSGQEAGGRNALRVAPVILAEPEVETQLGIQVAGMDGAPPQTFVRIKGLPLAAKLSDGHVVMPGVWAVPLTAVGNLRVLAPLASSGRTEVTISLVGVDGGVLSEVRSSLVVAPAWLLGAPSSRSALAKPTPPAAAPVEQRTAPVTAQAPAAPAAPQAVAVVAPPVAAPAPTPVQAPIAQPAARTDVPAPAPSPAQRMAALPPASAPATAPIGRAPTPPPAAARPAAPPVVAPQAVPSAAPAPPRLSDTEIARAEVMVQRGEGFIGQGNIAAARQFFRRASDMGYAKAAFRLGATYDPAELPGMGVVGLQGDPAEARRWYERARDLGSLEAGARITRLQAGR